MSLSSPGHHISPNRHPVGTSEHPVPPCTPPCSQRLASPQPITSHLHTTSFIFASSISASSHCSAVLATTSTLTAIGLAVGASEAPVPPSAHSTLVHRPLPLSLHTSHSPPCTAHRSCPPHLHRHLAGLARPPPRVSPVKDAAMPMSSPTSSLASPHTPCIRQTTYP